MTPTPLHVIADMADGLPILAVSGTVKYAGDLEHGIAKTSGKPWNKQFFVLAHNGAEVAATMWDAEGSEMKKGESVLIENTQNKKGQWSGMVKGSYTNKKNELCHTLEIRAHQIKIKPINGNLSGGESNRGKQTTDAPPPQTMAGQHEYGPRGDLTKIESQDIPATGINEARQHIMQAANLYVLCIRAVDSYIAKHLPEIAQTSEQFQATLASIWIEASSRRSTDGINWWSYIDKMEARTVHNGNEKVERQTRKEGQMDGDLMPYEETF